MTTERRALAARYQIISKWNKKKNKKKKKEKKVWVLLYHLSFFSGALLVLFGVLTVPFI